MSAEPLAKPDSASVMVIGSSAEAAAIIADLCSALPRPPTLIETASARAALDMLRRAAPDLIVVRLTCLSELGATTEDAVSRLAKSAAGALLVTLAEAASVSTTLAVMGAGAHDCLATPYEHGTLGTRVVDLARRHGKAASLAGEPWPAEPSPSLADAFAEMQQAYQQIARLTGSPVSPTGSGERKTSVLPMWQQEQRIIEEAIASYSGNIALAAAALEISPSTIYRKRQTWADVGSQVA